MEITELTGLFDRLNPGLSAFGFLPPHAFRASVSNSLTTKTNRKTNRTPLFVAWLPRLAGVGSCRS